MTAKEKTKAKPKPAGKAKGKAKPPAKAASARLRLDLTALIVLTAIGAAALLAWRWEMTWRDGWNGHGWLDWWHGAAVGGVALFLAWLWRWCGLTGWRRLFCMATMVTAGLLWARLLGDLLSYYLSPSLFYLTERLIDGDRNYQIKRSLIYVLLPLTPLVVVNLRWLFRPRPPLVLMLAAVLLYAIACPATLFLLAATGHPGDIDPLNAIRSGYLLPWLILGLGLPFVSRR